MANISIDELSLTIAELIDLDPDQKSTIESAVTRAISAKDIVGGNCWQNNATTNSNWSCHTYNK